MEKLLKKRTLAQLSKKAFNTPLFVTQESLAPIVNYLSDPERTLRLAQLETDDVEPEVLLRSDFGTDDDYRNYQLVEAGVNPKTMVGTVDIKGTLVNRAGQTQACVELTSYEKIKKTFESQIGLGAKTIVMQIDSGGGEAYRLFGAAKAVRKLADDNNVKIITYIDGTAASAAYGWASIADEIIANPQGRAGSVGVVVQLYNDSKALEKIGIERSFIYAGKNKIPFDDQGSFTEDFKTSLQNSVDKSYETFTTFIASNRNMSVDEVVKTNAKVFDADEALSVGFIDKIMELEEFEHYVSTTLSNSENNNSFRMSDDYNNKEENMDELAQLQAQLAKMTEDLTSAQASLKDQTDAVAKLTETQTNLQATVDTLTESLKSETEAKEALQKELDTIKADAITADRKQRLETVLGTENDQVAALLTSTENLSEEAFSSIVTAMSAKIEKEDKEMEEKGNGAEKQAAATNPFTEALLSKIKQTS